MGQGVNLEISVQGVQKMIDAAQKAASIPRAYDVGAAERGIRKSGGPRQDQYDLANLAATPMGTRRAADVAYTRLKLQERIKAQSEYVAQGGAEGIAAKKAQDKAKADADRARDKVQRDAERAQDKAGRDADRAQRQQEAEAKRRRRALFGEPWDDFLSKATKFSRAAFFIKEAVEMVTRPFENAAKASRELSAAMLTAGGGGGLSALDIGMGREPGSFAGAANSFRDRRSSDPWTIMTMGYMAPAKLGGDQDNAAQLRRAIERLASVQGENNRLLAARRSGLEEFLPITYASQSARAIMFGEGERAEAQSKANRGTQGDIAAYMGAAGSDWQRFFDNTAETRKFLAGAWLGFSKLALAQQQLYSGHPIEAVKEFFTPTNKEKKDAAVEQNTLALQELSGAIKTSSMTIGGKRAQAAIPPALRGLELERNFEADRVKLGGVAVR